MKTFIIIFVVVVVVDIAWKLFCKGLASAAKPKKQTDIDTMILACYLLCKDFKIVDAEILRSHPSIREHWSDEEIIQLCTSSLLRVLLFSVTQNWHDQSLTQWYESRIDSLCPYASMHMAQMDLVQRSMFPDGMYNNVSKVFGRKNNKTTLISFVSLWLATTLLCAQNDEAAELANMLGQRIARSRV